MLKRTRFELHALRSDTDPVSRTIVIIGAGFSGTTVATHLLRLSHRQPLRVVLLDRARIARGVAYGPSQYPHLLNVPASRMSANPDNPTEFLAFARRHNPAARADDFLPRAFYGEYLESCLAQAERGSAPMVKFQRLHGSAIALERVHRGKAVDVYLDDGRRVVADQVVLALGNPAPAPLPGSEALRTSQAYIDDPWREALRFQTKERVLVAGTGLTMADIVVAGRPGLHQSVEIHALSPHGLVPTSQAHLGRLSDERAAIASLRVASVSLRQLFRKVRELCEESELRGGDWREVVTIVRELTPALWRTLANAERRRFLRHVRSYWDVHRHRLPPSVWVELNDMRRKGQLHIHAGRIVALEPLGKQVRVTFKARGATALSELRVDRVINCTGPDHDVARTPEPLLRGLLAQGHAVRDHLGIGIVTDQANRLVGASGHPVNNIYYIGPMLRATHWETTAVAELREHAARVAHHLADTPDECAKTPHVSPDRDYSRSPAFLTRAS